MRRSPLPILFVTVFLDLLGFGLVVPFLAYAVEALGGRAATVGLLMSTYSLAQFVFAAAWGRVSDRVGRRPILLLGLLGSTLGFAVFGLAGSVAVLFVGRLIAGVAGATIPTAQAYIADVTRPEDRARGMGLIGAAFGLGFILGPAAGGLLSAASLPLAAALGGRAAELLRHNPYALPSLAAAFIALLNLVAALFFLPESLPPELRARARDDEQRRGRLAVLVEGLSDPRVGALVAVFFCAVAGFSMMETTLTLLLERRLGTGPEGHPGLVRRIGWLFAFIGVISAAVQGGLMGRLSRRYGEQRLLVSGLASTTLGLAALPLATSWALVALCCGLLALGSALSNPATSALISRLAGADRQGGTLGFTQSAGSLARVLGPALAGVLFQRVGPSAPFVCAALLSAGAVGLAVRAALAPRVA